MIAGARAVLMLLALAWLPVGAGAQALSGLARVIPDQSWIEDTPGGGLRIELQLSLGVPYRAFLLGDGTPRLVLDFREVDWSGLKADSFTRTTRAGPVRFGAYIPGWSRMVIPLAAPMTIEAAALRLDELTGAAHLGLTLTPATAADFAAAVGAPRDARWDLPAPAELPVRRTRGPDAPLVVVLDPGHGGIDPGAEQGGVEEKDLMLTFARELREAMLRAGGFEVVMTRDDDYFVSLERRIAMAHRVDADIFISLHADSLSEGLAHGATVHVLARDASDVASAKLAERHNRGEILSGVDLSKTDDAVTDILLDLARTETQPRTEALARALVDGMAQTGGPMNRRPLRAAAFSVLKSADIPSVLVEIGFLSSPRDAENLRDPQWRAGMAAGIVAGLAAWRAEDAARRPLVRQ